jgi:transcriptional regulator with XRE-family HTH domain
MTSHGDDPLAAWLIAACRARRLSWREASLGAGVDKGTISAIVRGQQPGLAVCKALATFFQAPPEQVLRLAGHLASLPRNPPPEMQALLRALEGLPTPLQAEVVVAWRAILELASAVRRETATSAPGAEERSDRC